MNKRRASDTVDKIQEGLTCYASELNYDRLTPEAIHAAKVRIIDTLGACIAGFFGVPCVIARNLAAVLPNPSGVTILGTRMKTMPDMAAFVNGITSRYPEMTDTYHWPGAYGGHPSDIILPLMAAAEHVGSDGRAFMNSVVLGYEVFCCISDIFDNWGFDYTNLVCLGTAVGAGKLLQLSSTELAHCISMAVVPNAILRQVRSGNLSMWKVAASAHAGRAGVFAALLARAGMEGPHLPFEGKSGWCDHVARERLRVANLSVADTPYKIESTLIKNRPSAGGTISSILAAEKVAPVGNFTDIVQVTVEANKLAKKLLGTNEHRPVWNPDSREIADHSIPYVVAMTLIYGTVTQKSFEDVYLWNPHVRALMQKVEVVENEEFTRAYTRSPVEHRTRITVVLSSGERRVAEAGGDEDDLSAPRTDAQIAEKFRSATEELVGARRVNALLDRLWHLEDIGDVGEISSALVLG